MVAATLEAFGGLDVLVNNAGAIRRGVLLHELSTERWDEQLAVNLTCVFLVTRAALRAMLERDGDRAIVNVASTLALAAAPGGAVHGGQGRRRRGDACAGARVRGAESAPTASARGSWTRRSPRSTGPAGPLRKAEYARDYPLGRLGEPDDGAVFAHHISFMVIRVFLPVASPEPLLAETKPISWTLEFGAAVW
jgi:3-oxoacyl-[acyl-carrier protein] reductase